MMEPNPQDAVTADEAQRRRLVQWAAEHADVRAMILTSTRANPHAPADPFSDYDVILAVTDIAPWLADDGWLEDFGRVLVVYRDPVSRVHGLDQFARITQYEDGLKIDFIVWPVEMVWRVTEEAGRTGRLPNVLDVGYVVLLDKDGLTANLPPPTLTAHVPSPPSQAAYGHVVQEFYHEATYVAKHLWRGDLMPAKYNLDQAMKQDNLRQMLEWRMEIDHGWSVKPGAYGKSLHKRLPPEIWAELERTYVGADVEENWDALFRTIALFRSVGIQVGDHLGLAYPHDLHRRVMAYLQRVQSLGHSSPRR